MPQQTVRTSSQHDVCILKSAICFGPVLLSRIDQSEVGIESAEDDGDKKVQALLYLGAPLEAS